MERFRRLQEAKGGKVAHKRPRGKPGHKKRERGVFSTISLPTSLVDEVERVVDEFGYWPRKTDFVREAVVQKMERYKELEERTRTLEAEEDDRK